jgi:hypothetical protein
MGCVGLGDREGSASIATPGLNEKAGRGGGLEDLFGSCRAAISSRIGCVGLGARSCLGLSSEVTPGLNVNAGRAGSLGLREIFRL